MPANLSTAVNKGITDSYSICPLNGDSENKIKQKETQDIKQNLRIRTELGDDTEKVSGTMASVMVAVNLSDSKPSSDGNSFLPWDNPDNVITFETFITAENIINCYINPIIFCIGVPANVLNCVVFFRQGSLKNCFR